MSHPLFDFALELDSQGQLIQIIWNNIELKKHYYYQWLQKNDDIMALLQAVHGQNVGEMVLDDTPFRYEELRLTENRSVYLFSQADKTEALLENAFEHFSEGLQIYDREGRLVYCNQNSRRISSIPDSMDIIGKHMLDIWLVDESKSAVLACLKKRAPVKNRVDTFASLSAGDVTTVNTAHPLFCGEKLEGALLIERDITAIQRHKTEIQTIMNTLDSYTKRNPDAHLSGYTFEQIIGKSASFLTAIDLAKKFAILDCNILLVGETGTGKEMFAQSIHHASIRHGKEFVAINCAAMPDTLIESTLFGTTKGAFTSSENRPGLFEEANGGTLFLDELNSMSLLMQSKILRVIQEGTFRRVGGSKVLRTDVRIISSCNEDPFSALENGSLRRDLFYRLSSVQIIIPPLRDRTDDLELLIDHYVGTRRYLFAKSIQSVSSQVKEVFQNYQWPGNVRELFHVLDYAMSVMDSGEITLSCLPTYLLQPQKTSSQQSFSVQAQDIFHTQLACLMGAYESQLLSQVLEHYGGNISKSAKSLGISRQSLSYRLHKYGIEV